MAQCSVYLTKIIAKTRYGFFLRKCKLRLLSQLLGQCQQVRTNQQVAVYGIFKQLNGKTQYN